MQEKDLLLSGGFGRSSNSARAGYLPVPLERLPLGALTGIGAYVRLRPDSPPGGTQPPAEEYFRLYCAPDVRFAEVHRRRLMDHGTKFLYIRMADQARFRQQVEEHIAEVATDTALAVSERSAIIYETSVELINELLSEPDLLNKSPRLERISRAITMLVVNNPNVFPHLFAASHHDFYTATHMVNVATWMVPLAFEMGIQEPERLNLLCLAGMLHDMGKVVIPESVLNKPGKLSAEEWALIKRHPVAGCEYLERFGNIPPIVHTITRQHHERLDGSGYPDGLKGDQIDILSRVCAVVDSFDAMTAFRPFKQKTLSVEQAIRILQKEAPDKYDANVVNTWVRLVTSTEVHGVVGVHGTPPSSSGAPPVGGAIGAAGAGGARASASPEEARLHARKAFHCPARLHLLERKDSGSIEHPAVPIVAHSISRGGLGFLSQTYITPGESVRVYLLAKGYEQRPFDGLTVRCRTHSDLWHEIGMQFSTVETETVRQAA